MDIFDHAVAKGLMTSRRATGVLIAKRKHIAQSSSVSVNEGIATSGTARRVLSWLRSAGLEQELSSVEHLPFLKRLIPFMVEEGLHEVVWMWLDTFLREEPGSANASPVLDALVRANIAPGVPLDAGYSTLLVANSMFSKHESFGRTYLQPWRRLSMLSTVFAWQRMAPSEALFDSFVSLGRPLHHLSPLQSEIDQAHLALHHPTHPDATEALKCLQSRLLDQVRDSLEPFVNVPKDVVRARGTAKRVVLMATDAAQHLTRIGRDDEATWVGDVLLEKLGRFMGIELVSGTPEPCHLEPNLAMS